MSRSAGLLLCGDMTELDILRQIASESQQVGLPTWGAWLEPTGVAKPVIDALAASVVNDWISLRELCARVHSGEISTLTVSSAAWNAGARRLFPAVSRTALRIVNGRAGDSRKVLAAVERGDFAVRILERISDVYVQLESVTVGLIGLSDFVSGMMTLAGIPLGSAQHATREASISVRIRGLGADLRVDQYTANAPIAPALRMLMEVSQADTLIIGRRTSGMLVSSALADWACSVAADLACDIAIIPI